MNSIKKLILKWKTQKIKLKKTPNWENVFQSTDEYEIRIKKLLLENEDIRVVIYDQRDSSYNAFGYIYLSVPSDSVEQAKMILANNE